MGMYLELSRPAGDVSRWEKVLNRLIVLYKKSEGEIKYIVAGTLSLVFAFLVNSLVIDVFEASKIATLFWIFIGIVLAANKFERKNDKKTIN
jgi:hypothetical protein